MVKKVLRICRLVSTKYANVTDTADGQTDTGRRHRPHLRRASRGKIKQLLKYSWDATWNIPPPEITRRESLKTGTNPYSWPYPIRGLSSGGDIPRGDYLREPRYSMCFILATPMVGAGACVWNSLLLTTMCYLSVWLAVPPIQVQ